MSSRFTVAEIREVVHEYQVQPHGSKRAWLVGRGVTYHQLRRWRSAVYAGDLDRGLIPRRESAMTIPPSRRTSIEIARAAERAAHATEVARLNARVQELEQTNEALGKAIGLLHAMSDQEPDANLTTNDPPDS